MRLLKKRGVLIISSVLLLIPVIIISGCKSQYEDLDLNSYQYRDTKDLVKFVYDASLILKKDGLKSLKYFQDNRKRNFTHDRYLYIYDMNGVNIYHAGMPA